MDRSGMFWGFFVVLVCHCAVTDAYDPVAYPLQGFFMAANLPEVGSGGEFYIYAIHTSGGEAQGEINLSKDGGLPRNTAGVLPDDFGYYLDVWPASSTRDAVARYGQYTGGGLAVKEDPTCGYTFVKPPSKTLNTGGVYTVTIYPVTTISTALAEPVFIGVGWQPGTRKIVWSKDHRRGVNQGPRLRLTDTDQAGLYTIFRPTRGKLGWAVQILVIAASCPKGQFKPTTPSSSCMPPSIAPCENGGVLKNNEDKCMCPPFFVGDSCSCAVTGPAHMLGKGNSQALLCEDLPGGNPTCSGHLICYGDNYGCKCASGWQGNRCDQPCRTGWWGADCEQECPDSEHDCDRFFGPMTNWQSNGCDPTGESD